MYDLQVRFLTELAWQQHFVTNMFIRPKSTKEIEGFAPEFTIINACKVVDDDWKRHGINSEVFVAFNIEKRVAIIGGTWYGGEMKKGKSQIMIGYVTSLYDKAHSTQHRGLEVKRAHVSRLGVPGRAVQASSA